MTVPNISSCRFFAAARRSPISRIVMVVLALGIGTGCRKAGLDDSSPTAPGGPLAPGSLIVYDVIGASDANGVGSSVVCLPLTECPDGMGYAPVAARQLRGLGFGVSVENHGIPTAVISARFQSLGQQYGHLVLGNFIAQELPGLRANATLVTIFAGGNEVNIITAALGRDAGGANPIAYIDAQVAAFAADFATLLTGIRSRAAAAQIVALNVPNLAGLPVMDGDSLAQRQAAQRASVGMSAAVNAFRGQGIVVVDVSCDARSYLPSNYSNDGFHPNDAGYAYMATEIVRAVTSSSYPAPQSRCGAMTMVPDL
jgi:lysophospholipase L1-like esterase